MHAAEGPRRVDRAVSSPLSIISAEMSSVVAVKDNWRWTRWMRREGPQVPSSRPHRLWLFLLEARRIVLDRGRNAGGGAGLNYGVFTQAFDRT